MKTKTTQKIIVGMGIAGLAVLPLTAGPSISLQIGVPPSPPPPVIVQPPPPPPPPPVVYPESYAWDGYEYVGVVGGQYYYLGPGNVWLALDVERQARFHEWERVHADWRDHAVHYDRNHPPVRVEEDRPEDRPHDDRRDHPPVN